MADLLHLPLVAGICWAVLCRASHMTHRTLARIRWQHGLLNAAAVLSLIVPGDLRAAVFAAGVLAFLVLGSARWRDGAPAGTQRGME